MSWFTCKDLSAVSRLASVSVSLLRSDKELVQQQAQQKLEERKIGCVELNTALKEKRL